MFNVCLINMPFASIHVPSFALTQLEAVVKRKLAERVSVEVFYLNHDCARYIGIKPYDYLSIVPKGTLMGEHFFRHVAFPELPDNTDEFFRRFYPHQDEQTQKLKRIVQEKRQGAERFLDELIDRYCLDQANIVGFTSSYIQSVACFAMARKLKERVPGIIIVMGGANCEAPMGDAIVKNVESIDFVFSGPALKSFPEFVGYCLDREMDKCHRIAGVFSKENRMLWPPGIAADDQPDDDIYVAPTGQDLDINTRIELDYDAFLESHDRNFFNEGVVKILLYETSRGCWWAERSKCTFCGLNGLNAHYQAMSPERAIEQFKYLFERYASRCSYFWSVDNIMPKDYPEKVFARLDTPQQVVITCHMKTNLDEGDLEKLSRAGVKGFQPGLESLNTSMLKLMGKGTTAFGNLRFLMHCMLHDIYPLWNMLLGFPDQKREAAEAAYRKYVRDMPLLVHLPPPFAVFPLRIDRYSHYFYNAERYGLDLRPYEATRLIYPFDEGVLSEMAYCFVDEGNFNAEYFRPVLKWIDKIRSGMEAWWRRWHGQDQSILPQLFFEEGVQSFVVYDSRSGQAIRHQVGDVGKQVLMHLTQPKRIADLAADLAHLAAFDPNRTIAFLQERGLVFQEEDRYMSLVFSKEPPSQPRLSQGDPRLELMFTLFPNVPLRECTL